MGNMVIIALAMFATQIPLSANAAGVYVPIDIGQNSISNPHDGDITGVLAVSPIEEFTLVNLNTLDGGSAIFDFGTTAVLSVKALVMEGGGLFKASTAYRPII